MTTTPEARQAMYTALINASVIDSANLTFDNEKYDPPDDQAWMRFTVRHTVMGQETLGGEGNRKFRRLGIAVTQIFTPIDQGVSEADTLAQLVKNVFEGVRLTGTTVRFLDVQIIEVGPENKWYQVNVEANFEYDETR